VEKVTAQLDDKYQLDVRDNVGLFRVADDMFKMGKLHKRAGLDNRLE